MTYSNCDKVPNIAQKEKVPENRLIEVEIWEAFIIKHSSMSGRFLLEHSIDNGPAMKENLPHGRICYRFNIGAWEESVKPFLNLNRIPVKIRANSYSIDEKTFTYLPGY